METGFAFLFIIYCMMPTTQFNIIYVGFQLKPKISMKHFWQCIIFIGDDGRT